MISWPEYPNSLSAAGFQLVTIPASEQPTIASLEDSTTAAALSCLEGLSLLGHVVVDSRRADNLALFVADRRDGYRDRHHRSVLSDSHGLQVLNSVAILDAGQVCEELAGSALWSQAATGLADNLLGGVAVHPLGGRVPARDGAFERIWVVTCPGGQRCR